MISKETVHKIADLARLELTDKEVTLYAEQFTAILEHFNKLQAIKTDGVEPLVSPSPLEGEWRSDEVKHGLGGDKAVVNAPARQGKLFKVPPVVGEA